jgi:CHAT domain
VEQQPNLRLQFPDVGLLDPRAQYLFDFESQKSALQTLYSLGINMYDTLFYSGDDELSEILRALETYGNEKTDLRILIYSDATYLPWQLLHAKQADDEPPESSQFWGNKYIIGVIPIDSDRDCGRLPGEMLISSERAVLYVHYWQMNPEDQTQLIQAPSVGGASSSRDTVSRLGEMFGQLVTKSFVGAQVVRNRSDFTSRVKADHRDIGILWSFTHGRSSEKGDQWLDFSESDSISAYDIKTATIAATKPPYFASRPFVFLNGCETGTQGARGTTDYSLPGIFLIRGARGVVATEAPVWDTFATTLGLFFWKSSAGMDAGYAMLQLRREFLMHGQNPLGLLYSYCGTKAMARHGTPPPRTVIASPSHTSGRERSHN